MRKIDPLAGAVKAIVPAAAVRPSSPWAKIEAIAATFKPGDIVTYPEDGTGIITRVGLRSVVVMFAHGGHAGGPGLLHHLKHREPRVNLPVPAGALGNHGWNREQAVSAALRRLDMASVAVLLKLTGAVVHGYRLSGWRRDKHGHYRIWIGRPHPIVAASLNRGELAVPKRTTGQRTACERFNVPRFWQLDGPLATKKASADAWLAKTIKAVKERAHG